MWQSVIKSDQDFYETINIFPYNQRFTNEVTLRFQRIDFTKEFLCNRVFSTYFSTIWALNFRISCVHAVNSHFCNENHIVISHNKSDIA